uniref:Putative secreted protein n=1 Tax=Anopheles darlingi TaxID=43151 RepID=A0A2M4DAY9_ANODA
MSQVSRSTLAAAFFSLLVSCVSIMKLCTCFSARVSSSFRETTATSRAVQPAPIIPVLTAMPRPQYVLGTISPKPTLRKVIAINHMAFNRLACSSS